MPTEAEVRAAVAAAEQLAAEHPNWAAFAVWASRERKLYEASRRAWRAQNPAVDVAAIERDYDLSPAVLAIQARLGVREGGAADAPW